MSNGGTGVGRQNHDCRWFSTFVDIFVDNVWITRDDHTESELKYRVGRA